MSDEQNYSDAGEAIRRTMQGSSAAAWGRGVVGAVIGAIAGYYAFWILLNNGAHAPMLPGAMVGLGFSLGFRRPSLIAGAICGIAGLVFGAWCEAGSNAPPQTLVEYIEDYRRIPTLNIVLVVLGGVVAFWFGRGK